MTYRVKWDRDALLDLKKIDKHIALKIVEKVTNYLVEDPVHIGKPLLGKFKGLVRYRIGDYRIIYERDINQQIIIVVRVGHRSSVY